MRRRLTWLLIGCACGDGGGGTGADASGSGESGADVSSSAEVDSTASTTASTSGMDSGESSGPGSSESASSGGGDGLLPTAVMLLPSPQSGLPSGTMHPLVGGGAGEEAIELVELLVDDRVVASGDGVPMLWNLDEVDPGGAVSVESIDGDGFVEVIATGLHTHKVFGLAPPDQAGDPMADPYYRFYLTPNGNVFLRNFQPAGFYAQGDVLRIEVAQGIVRYLKNAVELHAEPLVDGEGPLVLDVMLNARASLAEIVMSTGGAEAAPVTWSNVVLVEEATGLATAWDTTAVSEDVHLFTVRVVDAGGDMAISSPVQKVVDNTAPMCAIVSPTEGQVVAGVFQIEATAADLHLGIEAIIVDDMLVSQQAGLDQVMHAWDTAGVANGSHEIRFDVYDDGGNMTSCTVDVTVSN